MVDGELLLGWLMMAGGCNVACWYKGGKISMSRCLQVWDAAFGTGGHTLQRLRLKNFRKLAWRFVCFALEVDTCTMQHQ